MNRYKELLKNYSSVYLWVEIPIGLRVKNDSAYRKHCKEVNRMAGRGNGISGGGSGLGAWYDHVIRFDAKADGKLNERDAAAFIQKYKTKYPKHRIRLVTVEGLGYIAFYGKQNAATKPCVGSIATFVKQALR
jgi:hypothetical protein